MILTGPAIEQRIADGSIVIDPYDRKLVGPNSVDLRLHGEMKIYQYGDGFYHPPLDMKAESPTNIVFIPEGGCIIQPGTLYLARTIERIGSNEFVPMVEGRSSCGRLGLQVHMTAGFCDTGFFGNITLEMTVVHPLCIYPGVAIAQVFFLRPEGAIRLYQGRYQGHEQATPSLMHLPPHEYKE